MVVQDNLTYVNPTLGLVAKNIDDNVLNILKKNADFSTVNNQHSAGFLKNGHLISQVGFNKFSSNKKLSTIHAEIDALFKFIHNRTLQNCNQGKFDIIIIRLRNNTLKNSRPCSHCLHILKLYSNIIHKVYYSNTNGNIVYEFLNDMTTTHYSTAYRRLHSF